MAKKVTLEEAIVKDAPYEVPENWVWSRLEYVSELITGNTPSKKIPRYYGEDIAFIKPADLDQGRYLISSNEYLSFEGGKKARILSKNSIAVCCIGSIGKAAYLEIEGATNQQINSIIPKRLLSLYIYYYVLTNHFQSELLGKASATTIAIVNKSKMGELSIPIAPLEEQERIVARIETLFEKVDRAKELIEEARAGFEKRKAAILEKVFRGELTEKWREENRLYNATIDIKGESTGPYKLNEQWKWIKFNKLGALERGKSKHRPRNDPKLFGGEYPFIQTGDVARARVEVNSHSQTLTEFGLQQSRLFPKGTVCITIAANIGDTAILAYDCCFPDSVVGFTPNEYTISKYIYYYITTIKSDLDKYAPATAQKNINLKILSNIDIPLPSLEEQTEIVSILDKLLEEESKIEELTNLEEQIELIKKSILAKAFRGELGTNDPEEESAVELLKEILSK